MPLLTAIAWRCAHEHWARGRDVDLEEHDLALDAFEAFIHAVLLLAHHDADVGQLVVLLLGHVRLEVLKHALHFVSGLLAHRAVVARDRTHLADLGLQVFEVREERLLFARLSIKLRLQVRLVLFGNQHVGFEGLVDALDGLLEAVGALLDLVLQLLDACLHDARNRGNDFRLEARQHLRDILVELGAESCIGLHALGAGILGGFLGLFAHLSLDLVDALGLGLYPFLELCHRGLQLPHSLAAARFGRVTVAWPRRGRMRRAAA